MSFLENIDTTCEWVCVETSKDKYYAEMCNNLTDYNDRNYMQLLKVKIREKIHKVMEEESVTDSNNLAADTFSHGSNEQR